MPQKKKKEEERKRSMVVSLEEKNKIFFNSVSLVLEEKISHDIL
jgi:hypothetical protein